MAIVSITRELIFLLAVSVLFPNVCSQWMCTPFYTVPESGSSIKFGDALQIDIKIPSDVDICFPKVDSYFNNSNCHLFATASQDQIQNWFRTWQIDLPRLDLLVNGSVAYVVESSLFTLFDSVYEYKSLENVKKIDNGTLRLLFRRPFTTRAAETFSKADILYLLPGSADPRHFSKNFGSKTRTILIAQIGFLMNPAAIMSCDGLLFESASSCGPSAKTPSIDMDTDKSYQAQFPNGTLSKSFALLHDGSVVIDIKGQHSGQFHINLTSAVVNDAEEEYVLGNPLFITLEKNDPILEVPWDNATFGAVVYAEEESISYEQNDIELRFHESPFAVRHLLQTGALSFHSNLSNTNSALDLKFDETAMDISFIENNYRQAYFTDNRDNSVVIYNSTDRTWTRARDFHDIAIFCDRCACESCPCPFIPQFRYLRMNSSDLYIKYHITPDTHRIKINHDWRVAVDHDGLKDVQIFTSSDAANVSAVSGDVQVLLEGGALDQRTLGINFSNYEILVAYLQDGQPDHSRFVLFTSSIKPNCSMSIGSGLTCDRAPGTCLSQNPFYLRQNNESILPFGSPELRGLVYANGSKVLATLTSHRMTTWTGRVSLSKPTFCEPFATRPRGYPNDNSTLGQYFFDGSSVRLARTIKNYGDAPGEFRVTVTCPPDVQVEPSIWAKRILQGAEDRATFTLVLTQALAGKFSCNITTRVLPQRWWTNVRKIGVDEMVIDMNEAMPKENTRGTLAIAGTLVVTILICLVIAVWKRKNLQLFFGKGLQRTTTELVYNECNEKLAMFNMIDENGTYRVLTKYSAENDMGMCTLAAGGKIRLRGYLAKMHDSRLVLIDHISGVYYDANEDKIWVQSGHYGYCLEDPALPYMIFTEELLATLRAQSVTETSQL